MNTKAITLPYIIAVDFDGTLCENKWPEIGKPNYDLMAYLTYQQMHGAKLILWTCRTGDQLEDAIRWCSDYGNLQFDAVNENLPEVINYFGGESRKIFAHQYVDDKSEKPDIKKLLLSARGKTE